MGIPPSRPGRHPPDRSRGGARGATRWRRSRPNPGATARARPVLEQVPRADELDSILAEFTRGWDRGESPRVEDILDRLEPCAPDDLIELIYHEFCLAEAAGDDPDPIDYLVRFPVCRDRLARLFGLHGVLGGSFSRSWAEPAALPESGDEVGPYRLVRELGRGGFARVFLAEQDDLDGRLVVLKVSARPSPESRLLARARHPHIVEVLRHVTADDGALHLVCMPFLGGATLAAVLDERRRRARRPKRGRDLLADLDRASAPEYPPPPGRSRPAREVMASLSYPQALAWIVARLAEALDHAQRRGVLHGDLKPSNVLLTADGQPMLFDFNLAVDWHASLDGDEAGETGGTLAYMAPERLLAIAEPGLTPPPRAAARHRADLYALGLLLREALTGQAPEVPEDRGGGVRCLAAALAAARGRADWVRAATRGVPSGLRPILERCL
ncbi:MAG: serine/threonine-protein kinase, partial [Isosphaeraceae bacterium]